MEVTINFDDEAAPVTMTTFGNFAETMTVHDIKKRIKERFGYPVDKQILKLGPVLLADTYLIKQIPSDESQRCPEKAVHISQGRDKGRSLQLRLCKRQCVLKVSVVNQGELRELVLPIYCSCSVYALKQIIAAHIKVPDNEQVISINNEASGSPSRAVSQVLNRDDRFLFEYLPLTPFMEEEFKKKDEQSKV